MKKNNEVKITNMKTWCEMFQKMELTYRKQDKNGGNKNV